MAPLVREFHSNLPFRDNTKVLVRGVWVPFDGATTNSVFELQDDYSEANLNLWNSLNYDEMLDVLTDNSIQWKTNSKNEVLNFPRTDLSLASKVWHYFIS